MNLLLLRPEDLTGLSSSYTNIDHIQSADAIVSQISSCKIDINDYRAEHIIRVLKLTPNDAITIGLINGAVGKASIYAINGNTVTLHNIELNNTPPKQLDVEVILALPRPRMLQRSLQTMATMGVKKIHLIHTQRVEKSFWQTPLLKPVAIKEQLILGLEQAKATQMPDIVLHKKWREVKDHLLPSLMQKNKVIAHPGNYPSAEQLPDAPTALAIGPEGGFTQDEVNEFLNIGFNPIQLGERILRVETAVPVLLAKLFEL